jgi:hypothetical protein
MMQNINLPFLFVLSFRLSLCVSYLRLSLSVLCVMSLPLHSLALYVEVLR